MADPELERSFSFVDLAGFTALTEVHGDKSALGVIDDFMSIVRSALGPGDEFVKSIGDAAMLACREPSAALSLLSVVSAACDDTPGFPLLRVGIHHGRALERDGDYYGSAVNLAARVAALAGGGQTFVTTSVAEVARERGFEVIALGPHTLHNVSEPVHLFQVRLGLGCATDVIDPVCRMRVTVNDAIGTLHQGGITYWLCSFACVARFAENPERYAQ